MMQLLQQQMVLNQAIVGMMNRQQLPQAPQPAAAPAFAAAPAPREGSMDTKLVPACPTAPWKQWTTRHKELVGFQEFVDKLVSWLSLIYDSYSAELREVLRTTEPIVLRNAEQGQRARRLFFLLQQSFVGYTRIETMIKVEMAARGDLNGYELLRLLRKEFSIFSRSEALHFRETNFSCAGLSTT